MSVAIVTGSSGLIGSEATRFLAAQGLDVVGIDNNLREYFFGGDGSTDWNAKKLRDEVPGYQHLDVDIRNEDLVHSIFAEYGSNISLVVHAAAQPSHDWAAQEPVTDFTVNALATLVLLEATRKYAPDAVFIFTSTNKVYGDTPNLLPLVERATRWDVPEDHPYATHGIDEFMSIDHSKHSVFGASKVAADVMCQEYGRYFGLKTGIFRGGCLTGPAHSGAELHGFLAYLVKCVVTGRPYRVFGYKGKQVRDNIHSADLVSAFWNFFEAPRRGEVYNLGGGPANSCSVLEAIASIEQASGRELEYEVEEQNRSGDHMWWVSNLEKFRSHYPSWDIEHSLDSIIEDIVVATQEREIESASA